jgi:hypothetical protein
MATGGKVNNGSDLETGGLSVTGNNGMGIMLDVSWSTTGHTWMFLFLLSVMAVNCFWI